MFSFTVPPDFYPVPARALTDRQREAIDRFTPFSADSALAAVSTLRAEGFNPADSAAVLDQAKLRTRAGAKFGDAAEDMLFTEAGYEQASRSAVADLHARRVKEAGIDAVADLGCGIGADSRAFAQAGLSVTAVERDRDTASIAAYNLRNFTGARVFCGDLRAFKSTDSDRIALWLDPARRRVRGGTTESRFFDPESFSPPLSHIRKLASTGIALGVKMSPGLPHEMIPDNCEAQWVSQNGTLLETVLWFNALARKGVRRSATVLEKGTFRARVAAHLTSERPVSEPAPVGQLKEYIYEPDSALVRSHLIPELATDLGAHLLDERIAYLTAEKPILSPAASCFRVLETMPLNTGVLKNWVRTHRIGALTIKKRGVDIVPEQLRKTLLAGAGRKRSESATLILTRVGSGSASRRLALHVEPLTGRDGTGSSHRGCHSRAGEHCGAQANTMGKP